MNMSKALSSGMVKRITKNESEVTLEYFNYASQKGFSKVVDSLMAAPHLGNIGEALPTLMVLIRCANTTTGQCNPSIEYLVEQTGRSKRSVIYDTEKLQTLGYIVKMQAPRNKEGKHAYSNNYIITAHFVIESLNPVAAEVIIESQEAHADPVEQPVAEEHKQQTIILKKKQQNDKNQDLKAKMNALIKYARSIDLMFDEESLKGFEIEWQFIEVYNKLVENIVIREYYDLHRTQSGVTMYDGSRPIILGMPKFDRTTGKEVIPEIVM